jgi:hypothetical protein
MRYTKGGVHDRKDNPTQHAQSGTDQIWIPTAGDFADVRIRMQSVRFHALVVLISLDAEVPHTGAILLGA